MKKQEEEGKYKPASFIGKVSMRRKKYIHKLYGGKREKFTKTIYNPHFYAILDNLKL